jgi:thiol-disulfide isomerase/thioredoxin
MLTVSHRTLAIIGIGIALLIGLVAAYRAEAPEVEQGMEFASTTASSTASTTAVDGVPVGNTLTPSKATTPKPSVTAPTTAKPAVVLSGRVAPELTKPTGFTNIDNLDRLSTDPFTIKYWLGKKVILLEFWTSSSLNSYHTIPYLNRWYEQYKDDGLLIIAVHTPQFSYERSKSVVDQIVFARKMSFPVVIDNEYGTWNAYKNTVWPHRYLIDLNGRIVYDHAGDGAYDATEAKIASLLAARADRLGKSFTAEQFQTPKDAFTSDLARLKTKEIFFGASRNTTLIGSALKEGPQVFTEPTTIPLNSLAMSGSWTFTKEYAQNMVENAKVTARYTAKGVYATLSAEAYVPVKILRDGAPLTEATAGKDVRFEKGESYIYVKEARVYDLIQDDQYGEHTITLVPTKNGLRAYVLMGE